MLQNFGIQNPPELESNLRQEKIYQKRIKMLIVCWVGLDSI